jgi:peptide subunit release factor 1 (eRF1)
MINPYEIEILKQFDNSSFQIMSIYLGADGVQPPTGEFLLKQFHSLLHQRISRQQRLNFYDDIKHVEKFLIEYRPFARSLIFFSAGKKLWKVEELESFLPTTLKINTSPYLDPLIQSLKKYSKYLVLLIDRQKVQLFTVEQGKLIEQLNLVDKSVPQKVKSTSRVISRGNSDINFRRNEELLWRHVERSVKAVVKVAKDNNIQFIVIGGHKEMFKKVTKALSENYGLKIAGNFVTELDIPKSQILYDSKRIAATIN